VNVLQAVDLLQRARNLGIDPNTIMYNTAISALGKSYRWEAAEKLFQMIPCPDTISYETMIAAYGLAGQIEKSESFFTAMLEDGHVPRDYAFCGLIAAYRSAKCSFCQTRKWYFWGSTPESVIWRPGIFTGGGHIGSAHRESQEYPGDAPANQPKVAGVCRQRIVGTCSKDSLDF